MAIVIGDPHLYESIEKVWLMNTLYHLSLSREMHKKTRHTGGFLEV
jgi:hypothetical protein